MRLSRIGAFSAAVMTASATIVGVSPAHAAEPPAPARLMPVDGTAWALGTGLPDTSPDGQQGLALTIYNPSTNPLVLAQRATLAALDLAPDGGSEYEGAVFAGFKGQPGSSLRGLSYAVNNPAGIEPCWDIGYIDANGNARTLSVDPTSRGSDFVVAEAPSAVAAGWTRYTFRIQLPPNTTLAGLALGADVTTAPTRPELVAFDKITVATDTATNSWNNATAFGLPGAPEGN